MFLEYEKTQSILREKQLYVEPHNKVLFHITYNKVTYDIYLIYNKVLLIT